MLSRELGKRNYDKYFFYYQKLIADGQYDYRVTDQADIYRDIYKYLKDNSLPSLMEKEERLADAMVTALRISRTFAFVLTFYIIAVIFVLTRQFPAVITVGAVLAMTVCMLLKAYEFVLNKYCFIDAHILLIYQKVLNELLTEK